ncbi:potassium voltage-gated channel subfamily E regulatory beta subunit 5 [Gymnogyps californianus]|uniref:potassium voltage-gated channel subfamily E regulatory beta subunit 5 n=1 Tax=Gymnogyps californianus TaxID=33616 RepID=UPI0021C99EE7|nr:potassium voltage-gated channel subfamily E regulatory beta subunit 5 [Gymnogyps californianus]
MNCSEPGRLQALLSALLRELRRGGNASAGAGSGPGPGGDASLYILLIMIFYGCLAGGLILAYTRSRKLESKHDPYHLYIERDWGRGGGGGGPGQPAEEGGPGPGEGQRLM